LIASNEVCGKRVNDCDVDERGWIVLDVDVAWASLAFAVSYFEGDGETCCGGQ
jgi:hypothetical protein